MIFTVRSNPDHSVSLCFCATWTPWDLDSVGRSYYRIHYFLVWDGVYFDIKANGWSITMVSVSTYIIISPFPEHLSAISFSEDFGGQTQFVVKLLLFSVYPFWRGSTSAWYLFYRAWNFFSAVSYLLLVQKPLSVLFPENSLQCHPYVSVFWGHRPTLSSSILS